MRLKKHGEIPVGATVLESVFEYKTYSPDPVDFMRLILTDSGSDKGLASMLFGKKA